MARTQFNFRLDMDMAELLRRLSEVTHLTLTDVVVQAIRAMAKKEGIPSRPVEKKRNHRSAVDSV